MYVRVENEKKRKTKRRVEKIELKKIRKKTRH